MADLLNDGLILTDYQCFVLANQKIGHRRLSAYATIRPENVRRNMGSIELMKRLRQFIRANRGDTIVEVLVAAAIVSLILVSGYSLSAKSTATVQDSKEHQQALSIANSEVEFLRRNSGLDTTSFDCFDSLGNVAGSDADTNPCSFTPAGRSWCTNDPADPQQSAYCYIASINVVSSTATSAHDVSPISVTYQINVDWDSILNGTSHVELFYRVSQGDPAYVYTPVAGDPAIPTAPIGPPSISGSDCKSPTSILPKGYCTKGPGGTPKYHYNQTFINKTTKVPQSQIKSCTWDFGDGTSVSGPASNPGGPDTTYACYYNQWLSKNYQSTLESKVGPYPTSCYKLPITAKLTIFQTNGKPTTAAVYTLLLPGCW